MMIKKKLTEDLHLSLGEYTSEFLTLRSSSVWKGSLALIEKYEGLTSSRKDGDSLFEEYGVGFPVRGFSIIKDRPFERATAYSRLLSLLQRHDPKQFNNIHKGTPYYFVGWAYFLANSFEEAMFYLDAAASEDLRLNDKNSPAITYFLLEEKKEATGYLDLHIPTIFEFTDFIRRFKKDTNVQFSTERLSSQFLKKEYFENVKNRTLITALFGYVLESGLHERHLRLRSSSGGSIEPFINHLFKGARILESILKLKTTGSSLEKLVENLPILEVDNSNLGGYNKSFKTAINKYHAMKKMGSESQDCNFVVSSAVRNMTGHSLVWVDEFQVEEDYLILNQSIESSILWSIYKLWN